MARRTKTNPNHKASFTIGVRCSCSCGWESSMWLNTGAKSAAASEWRHHRERCEGEG
jgi:hypothetical protein